MGWQLLPSRSTDGGNKHSDNNDSRPILMDQQTDQHDKKQSGLLGVRVTDKHSDNNDSILMVQHDQKQSGLLGLRVTDRAKFQRHAAYINRGFGIVSAIAFTIITLNGISWQYAIYRDSVQRQDHIDELPGLAATTVHCQDSCRIELVESIPENLTFPDGSPRHNSTFNGWKMLIALTSQTLDLSVFYWTLKSKDIHFSDPSLLEGEEILNSLVELSNKNSLQLRAAQNKPKKGQDKDVEILTTKGKAEVRTLDFTRLLGNGVLHTKVWVSDLQHMYVGSANMDCRSLTQVKELGAVLWKCPCLAQDLQKVFEVYWYLGAPNATVPKQWPAKYSTVYNVTNPMHVSLNNVPARVFISSSPSQFCADGRTSDIDAILHVIKNAKKYVHIAVMDYYPVVLFANPRRFWPVIDDALRKVALEKGVQVRVLGSWWKHTDSDIKNYLLSLAELNGAMNHAKIEVKLFQVPAFTEAQQKMPYARVNHNKYMVTDNIAYIGTSNWSGDYFIHTAGVGLVINQTSTDPSVTVKQEDTMQDQLSKVFDRDWNSEYAKPVSVFNMT